uniref:Uncharacterized protein n=1 Tax=Triticum urartu TaxID=4572 RepID=A0A8R7TIU5_TRIUA
MAPPLQPIAGSLSPPSVSTPSHGARSEGVKVISLPVVQSEVGASGPSASGDMCLHLCQPTFGDQQVAIHGGNNSGHLCTRIPASGYSRASGEWCSDVPPFLPLPPH